MEPPSPPEGPKEDDMTGIHPHMESAGAPIHDWTEHLALEKKQTYDFFISLMRAALLLIAFTLTGLVSFAFGHILPVGLGFVVIAAGALAVIIDMARHSHFGLALSVLAVSALVIAVSATH
jgi:hypothetical protein